MKKILVNYNFTPDKEWIGDDYLIYDRSDSDEFLKDFDKDKIIRTENMGNVDYDKLSYIVDNYDNLPDVFLWGKTNLFKYISPEEYETVEDNKIFTPLLTKGHRTYSDERGAVCWYEGDIYCERNDNYYMGSYSYKYFANYGEFARAFQLPNPTYLQFAPGGNYILTRTTVHKYSKDFYERMMSVLPYQREPAEAHMCERSYYTLWK